MSKMVSIIIPVKNSERTLQRTIDSLLSLNYPKDKIDVIFIDGGSRDKTIEMIGKVKSFKLIKLEKCPSPGFARNKALPVVKGDFVLFTDGDCVPDKDWVIKLVQPFEKDKDIGIVGGEILTELSEDKNVTELYCRESRFLSPIGRCRLKESGYMPNIEKFYPHEVDGNNYSPFFATANVAVKREVFKKLGDFWSEITGEDVDFNIRAQREGFKLYFQKNAVVYHIHRATLRSFMKQYKGYGFGHPLLIKKHSPKVFEKVFQLFGREFYIIVPFPLRGVVHIGDFHISNTLFLFAIIMFIAGLGKVGLVSLIISLLFFLKYFMPCFKYKPGNKLLNWMVIRYLSNLAFIWGGIVGSFKFKLFDIEASW